MTTRDLGFITARALAVFLLYLAIGDVGRVAELLIPDLRVGMGSLSIAAAIATLGLHLLIAWQLWLHADKFGGRQESAAVPAAFDMRQVRNLMLTGLGVYLIAAGLGPAAYAIAFNASHASSDHPLVPSSESMFVALIAKSSMFVTLASGVVFVIFAMASRKGGLLQLFGWPSKEELDEDL